MENPNETVTYSEREYNELEQKYNELIADNDKWQEDFTNLDKECAKRINELEYEVKKLREIRAIYESFLESLSIDITRTQTKLHLNNF